VVPGVVAEVMVTQMMMTPTTLTGWVLQMILIPMERDGAGVTGSLMAHPVGAVALPGVVVVVVLLVGDNLPVARGGLAVLASQPI